MLSGSSISPERFAELSRLAEAVAHHAYAPYSKFFVGAAVLLGSGDVATGCNVENVSYRLTTCAEQGAIAAAVARFGPAVKLRAVVVANLNGTACQPCGACRQTILEFGSPETLIAFPGADGRSVTCILADLLPAAFSQGSLGGAAEPEHGRSETQDWGGS